MKRALFVLLLAVTVSLIAGKASAQVLVIVHPGVTVDSVSKAELSKIFTGASNHLFGGSHVTPVLLKDGPDHVQFTTTYTDKSPAALMQAWRGLLFSGEGKIPKIFDSEEAEVDYVAHNPGAIGYIGKNTPHTGVKVLRVD
jgi:ABC-type phosphate transport system substrate-binding protein